MNKVNKILLLFVLVVSGFIWTTWQIMQSEMFASYAAEKITEYISKKTKLSVNFERIKFQLYPIGSILKSVEISSKEKEGLKNLYASEVGIYFDFLDFFSNKISVKRVSIVSAEAEFLRTQKNTEKSERKIDFKNTVKEIKKGMSEVNHDKITNWMKKNLPIELESLHFEDSVVRIGSKRYQLSNAEISIFNKTTELRGSIESALLDFLEIPNIKSVDSVEFDIQLSENDYRIRKLKISEGLSTLHISGKLQNKENIPIDLEVEAVSSLKRISELASISQIMGSRIEGLVSVNGKITGNAIEPVAKIDIKTAGIKSNFFRLREGDIKIKIEKGDVSLESLNLAQGIGWIKNKEIVPLYSIKKNKVLIKDITVQLNEMHTNDVLYLLNDELKTFKGMFSGLVTVSFMNGINEIKFSPHKEFSLGKFRLELPDKQDENILINDGVIFKNGDIVLKNLSDLYMDVSIEIEKTVIHAEGLISESGIDLQVKDSFIDLEEFGPISGTLLKGSGKILSRISGPYENVRFDFYPDLKDFEVIGLKLGDLSGKVSLDLKTLDLKLKNIKAKYKSTLYSGGGWLNFDEKEGMDIDIKIHKGFYSDTLEMLDILVKKLDFKLPNAVLEYKSNLKVKGPFDGEKLIVSGSVDGKELNFFLEDFNSIRGDFKYYGEGFQVTNLVLKKNNGSIRGSYSMNIKNNYIEYDATAAGMRLSDFKLFQMLKLGIDSELFGEFYGTGTSKDFSSRTHLKSLNGKIGNEKVGDSYFTVYNNGPDVFLTLNILDGVGNIESFLYLKKDKKKQSYVKGVVNSQNIKQVFGLLSAHNMDDPDLSGELSSEFYTQFDFFNPYRLDATLKMNKLRFTKGRENFSLKEKGTLGVIKKGTIEKLNINITSENSNLELKGNGNLEKNVTFQQNFMLGAHLAELLTGKIRGSSGTIQGKAKLIGKNKVFQNFMDLKGLNISLNYSDIPGSFLDTNFRVLLENKNIIIQEASSNYGNGILNLEGSIETVLPYPKLDLSWEIDNSRFPVFSKSNMVVGGKGKLSGDVIPYKLFGDLNIFHGEIVDDLDEFQSEVGVSTEYEKFIPKDISIKRFNLVDLDLGVDIVRPIRVFNSLTELYFDGAIRLTGEPKTPNISGALKTVKGKSKFKFKGYEFDLIDGEISFPKGRTRNRPDLKFAGVTDINNFNVKVEVIGPADKIAVGLSSTPPLSQEDIKSLLAIGVTTDVSKGLDDSQRQSMTTIGVGSMIFEQFKINQELNSSLGVRLSVLPEISEDETSLLQGKSGVSDTASTRVKSATKIRVQKKISEKVDLSVSSTVGGSMEQKQEMNINYKINKKLSLEGIYEVKSNEESEEENPNSIGIDLKWNTSF